MTIYGAIKNRHSVRDFTDKKIDDTTISTLLAEIDILNSKSGLNIQLLTDEPRAFEGFMPQHYGKFRGVKNYIAIVGKKVPALMN